MRDAGGLTSNGLWLAGEHTAPFIALGTTTGAWWSGQAVARRICAKYELDVPTEAEVEVSIRRDPVAGPDALPELNDQEMQSKKKDLADKKEHPDAANLNGLAI